MSKLNVGELVVAGEKNVVKKRRSIASTESSKPQSAGGPSAISESVPSPKDVDCKLQVCSYCAINLFGLYGRQLLELQCDASCPSCELLKSALPTNDVHQIEADFGCQKPLFMRAFAGSEDTETRPEQTWFLSETPVRRVFYVSLRIWLMSG